jgi:cytochrome b561
MSAAPKTVGAIDTFITMLRTACDDRTVYEQLEYLLSMPDQKRQALIHAWVSDMLIKEAPKDFIQAIACLQDDEIAEKAYQAIFNCGRPDPVERYTSTAIWLHWLIAALIVAAFALGLTMVDIPGLTPTKLKYFSWHKWLGVTVLLLACARLLWRLSHAAPPYPQAMPPWQRWSAASLHKLLYILIFAVPLSGYFYSLAAGVPVVYLGLVPLPVLIGADPELKPVLKALHYWLNVGLLACVSVHVLAALKHALIDRDTVMRRMLPLPGRRKDNAIQLERNSE